jgi:hypothetical protein
MPAPMTATEAELLDGLSERLDIRLLDFIL